MPKLLAFFPQALGHVESAWHSTTTTINQSQKRRLTVMKMNQKSFWMFGALGAQA